MPLLRDDFSILWLAIIILAPLGINFILTFNILLILLRLTKNSPEVLTIRGQDSHEVGVRLGPPVRRDSVKYMFSPSAGIGIQQLTMWKPARRWMRRSVNDSKELPNILHRRILYPNGSV